MFLLSSSYLSEPVSPPQSDVDGLTGWMVLCLWKLPSMVCLQKGKRYPSRMGWPGSSPLCWAVYSKSGVLPVLTLRTDKEKSTATWWSLSSGSRWATLLHSRRTCTVCGLWPLWKPHTPPSHSLASSSAAGRSERKCRWMAGRGGQGHRLVPLRWVGAEAGRWTVNVG